jgi:hypothetical protein
MADTYQSKYTGAEIDALLEKIENEDLSNLTTEEKSTLVAAINEVKGIADGKVDAEEGKGLSTNDYTDEDKDKLAGIEEGAEVNPVIADDLTTDDPAKVLSANQGKILKDNTDALADLVSTNVGDLETLTTTDKSSLVNATNEVKDLVDSNKAETNLKIATVEKDLNDFERVITSLNPNQEAKQTVSGIGMVSLPKNAANGQVSVTLKGRSLKNELNYNRETWAEWTKPTGVTVVNGELIITLNGSSFITPSLPTNLKPSTKYGILAYAITPASAALKISNNLTGSFVTLMTIGSTGNAKQVITTQSSITTNSFILTNSVAGTSGEQIKIKDIRIFELPAGSEIEADFETLTADELAQKYPYINGDSVKSTVSASRLKSVGKNLFNKSLYQTVAQDGRKCIKTTFHTGSSIAVRIQGVQWKPNTVYSFRFQCRHESINSSVGFRVFYTDGTNGPVYGSIGATFTEITGNSAAGKTIKYVSIGSHENAVAYFDIDTIQIEEGNTSTTYEPYKESIAYINGAGELRSLPNGVKDEVNVISGKVTRRIKKYVLQANDIDSVSNYAPNYTINIGLDALQGIIPQTPETMGNVSIAGMTEINGASGAVKWIDGVFGTNSTHLRIGSTTITTLEQAREQFTGLTITYQLATPIEIPIQTSGTLVSYPSGTVYIEPFVADAGIYTDKMEVLYSDLPIKALEKISKVDFDTGLETELDITVAVIAEDKLSFTHPDLTSGDIVFFVYEHGAEGTIPETEISYYDSRYVIQDSENGKFYKWTIASANGTPSIVLTEV